SGLTARAWAIRRRLEAMRWVDGTVTVEDSVASSTSLGGDLLRTTFLPSITTVTLGLIRMRDRSLCLGPVRLITFGPPKMSSTSVSWPIDGGLLVASAGGRFTIESAGGELRATLDGYNPMLPRSVYEATQLRLHHGLVRVQLLRLAGLTSPPPPWSRKRPSSISAMTEGVDLVIFGASGDLSRRKILPSLKHLAARNGMALRVIGAGRSEQTRDEFRDLVNQSSGSSELAA